MKQKYTNHSSRTNLAKAAMEFLVKSSFLLRIKLRNKGKSIHKTNCCVRKNYSLDPVKVMAKTKFHHTSCRLMTIHAVH